jgi:CheY-like chemotaxis protein
MEVKKTALIVDDEIVNRMLAESIFTKMGYSVLSAKDGKEGADIALRTLNNNQAINLILSDMLMPGMIGTDMYHKIRQETGKDLPVIFWTSTEDYLKQAQNYIFQHKLDSIAGVIQKPCGINTLMESVKKYTR